MISVVELRRCIAGIYTFCVVVYKFHHRQDSCLIILLLINKSSKLYLHCTILNLGLIVSLEIKGYGEILFNAQKIT